MNARSPITTHVLEISRGRAAQGVPVTLEVQSGPQGSWTLVKNAKTNGDGRIEDLMPKGTQATAGVYRLTFDVAAFYAATGTKTFYPSASIVFEISNPAEHHHVPLLLSPFGYSTYRGT